MVKSINATIVDLSNNQCWNDICEVLTPTGYPIMYDTDHYTKTYSENWASNVDFLTEF
jgi:hypothetical protein